MASRDRYGNDLNCHCPSDSEYGDESVYACNDNQPLPLISPLPVDGLGIRGKNYMVLRASSPMDDPGHNNGPPECVDQHKENLSFTSFLSSFGNTESFLQQASAYLLQFLSCSQRMFWFFAAALAIFYFYPLTCIVLIGCLTLILIGGHQNGDYHASSRTAKWTVTSFSYQMKDGLLVSPPFLTKCGQWRMVIKQKKGMEGLQTSFGLMCTDIFPEVEVVTACVTFFCTNQLGQELATGGMRNLNFQYEFQCPGDCCFSRYVRLPKKLLGQSEAITVHCTAEFRQKSVTFLRTLARHLNTNKDETNGVSIRGRDTRKGRNVVPEQGVILPGNLEFHEDGQLPSQFRPLMRFVCHPETKTFVWEIPEFCSLLENSELWGIFSPQFFVNSHDVCAVWRMKLLEVQGVFRLHVQLRGLPRSVKQVKLWYLLQLVDMYGDSIIPEHSICRVKYPDHLNLWDTTRHILYRRETIMERFVGGTNNGALTLRISLQMEPNDLALMEKDSDAWIQCPRDGPESETGRPAIPHGLLKDSILRSCDQKMVEN